MTKLYTSYLIRGSENLPPSPTPQKIQPKKTEIDKKLIRTSQKIFSTAA